MHSYQFARKYTNNIVDVLILVLMEDALVHNLVSYPGEMCIDVLILVLMEDALVPRIKYYFSPRQHGS